MTSAHSLGVRYHLFLKTQEYIRCRLVRPLQTLVKYSSRVLSLLCRAFRYKEEAREVSCFFAFRMIDNGVSPTQTFLLIDIQSVG